MHPWLPCDRAGAALGSIINEVRKEHLRTCVEKNEAEVKANGDVTCVSEAAKAEDAIEAAQLRTRRTDE